MTMVYEMIMSELATKLYQIYVLWNIYDYMHTYERGFMIWRLSY